MTGEEEALIDELFTRYRTAMLGRALQYMKHVQDAEDVVSDAWMSLLRQLPKLVVMDERARSTYILRSVQNASVDALRKAGAQARQQERLENEPPARSGRGRRCPRHSPRTLPRRLLRPPAARADHRPPAPVR